MNKRFREYVWMTRGFYVIRLAVALVVSLAYILIAAAIQYLFVDFLGESTFNYIVGGLLSLFMGIIFCRYIGALTFMLVKGWHVAALAYIPKLKKADASAVEVGIRAFNKNLISFGAVYAVRTIMNNLLSNFKEHLWELFGENPLAQWFMKSAANPIVEHIAGDILHYGFDATIFYLVRHPGEDINDVPGRVLAAVKQYLYCLPAIMLTSVKSFLFFRFIPKIAKWLFILWMFLTQGILAGILISVLMYPLFYILDNAFFDPLTMTMFIAAYAKTCDKQVDLNDPVVSTVNAILEEAEGIDSGAQEKPRLLPRRKRNKREVPEGSEAIQTTITSEEELYRGSRPQSVDTAEDKTEETIPSTTHQAEQLAALLGGFLSEDEDLVREVEDVTPPPAPPVQSTNLLANLARGRGLSALIHQSGEGLDDDPLTEQETSDEDEQ